MNDLTLLYYSCNIIPEAILQNIRGHLILTTKGLYPIISVTQEPIDFGQNICIGKVGQSKYNEYLQILIGLREVKTKYVACVEDDILYSPEHFNLRPPEDSVGYENNYWYCQEGKDYYWRHGEIEKRGGMWGCISETKHLLDNLSKRYEMFPDKNKIPPFFGEPGYYDERFGLENKKMFFDNKFPCVQFVNHYSMGGVQLSRFHRRYGDPKPENKCYNLDGFGTPMDLEKKYWNGY